MAVDNGAEEGLQGQEREKIWKGRWRWCVGWGVQGAGREQDEVEVCQKGEPLREHRWAFVYFPTLLTLFFYQGKGPEMLRKTTMWLRPRRSEMRNGGGKERHANMHAALTARYCAYGLKHMTSLIPNNLIKLWVHKDEESAASWRLNDFPKVTRVASTLGRIWTQVYLTPFYPGHHLEEYCKENRRHGAAFTYNVYDDSS